MFTAFISRNMTKATIRKFMHALINAPKSISVPGRHQKNACETFKFYQSNRIC